MAFRWMPNRMARCMTCRVGWCLESGKVFTSRMDANMFRIHSHAIAKVIIFFISSY